jgi:hypothetical protein
MPDTADLTARIERRILSELSAQKIGGIGWGNSFEGLNPPVNWTAIAEGVAEEMKQNTAPATPRVTPINDIGARILGINEEPVRDFGVYTEGGCVIVMVEVAERGKGYPASHEAIQYLIPADAMKFAKAFERCAIVALKESA